MIFEHATDNRVPWRTFSRDDSPVVGLDHEVSFHHNTRDENTGGLNQPAGAATLSFDSQEHIKAHCSPLPYPFPERPLAHIRELWGNRESLRRWRIALPASSPLPLTLTSELFLLP